MDLIRFVVAANKRLNGPLSPETRKQMLAIPGALSWVLDRRDDDGDRLETDLKFDSFIAEIEKGFGEIIQSQSGSISTQAPGLSE